MFQMALRDDFHVSVEVHNLLRRAKIFVKSVPDSSSSPPLMRGALTMTQDGLELPSNKDDSREMIRSLDWPGFRLCLPEGRKALSFDEDGACYEDQRTFDDAGNVSFHRVQAGKDGLFGPTMKSEPQSQALVSAIKRLDQESPVETVSLTISCAGCGTTIKSLDKLRRILPLPSVTWKDDRSGHLLNSVGFLQSRINVKSVFSAGPFLPNFCEAT